LLSKLRGGFQWSTHYLLLLTYINLLKIIYDGTKVFLRKMKTKLVIKEEDELDRADILYAILTEKVEMFETCYRIIVAAIGFMIVLTIGDYVDFYMGGQLEKHSAPVDTILYMILFCVAHLVYSMLASRLEAELQILEDSDSDSDTGRPRDSSTENTTASVITTAVLNFLGGTTMICAGGACNSVYISTLS
jgi:hypothetical protein